ncbi:MAG TPA: dienelactone hydrolase family protein [Anaerolineae bacterium]|nr:dienelactone hydrolase family protein [Anaerolineae bacterium]
MKKLDTFQKYLVEEFYDDYREGLISRRQFIRRVAYITGSMAATVSTMSLLGCSASELPDPAEPIPSPEPTATTPPDPTATTPPTNTPPPQPTEEAAVSEPTEETAAQLEPVPDAQSPLSVPEGDPAVISGPVTFTSQGAEITAYQARPVADGVYPAVLVCHENRGLTPHIEDVARRFAKEGYVALAIDLLSREGGTAAHDRDEVPGLLTDAGPDRHVADFAAGFDYLRTLDFVDGDRIGMTGYCFGGGITWRAATALPDLKAAVPFYGPAPDLDQVPNINAAVLGVYAEQDERINAGIESLEQALVEAEVTHQINIYPGVNHAFHNDTGQRYVEQQATQAWQDTLAWFAEYLRQA